MGLTSSSNINTMDSANIKQTIESTIASNCVVMYSKPSCPFCVMARKVLEKMQVEFLEIDINKEQNTSEIQKVLGQITGATTVPRVFVGGKCIGGGSETKQLHSSGQLQKMIDSCKA